MTPSDVKATLSFSDGSPSMDLPLYKGSIGPDVIDIRKLYGQTGKFTYDPGFLSTASCNSTITYIDGDKGELPNETEKADFVKTVTNHTMVNEQMQFFLRGFRRDAHPLSLIHI